MAATFASTPGRIDSQLRKLEPKARCMAPLNAEHDCGKQVISAHTISRSGSLGAIARDGKVYSYRFTLQGFFKNEGRPIPQLTGWRDASTFPGFCGPHDKRLFSPLEDVPFVRSKEQCFLLAYRAIARELYTKRNSDAQKQLRSIHAHDAGSQRFVDDFNHGVEIGLRDALKHKRHYDSVLLGRRWDAVRAYVVTFNATFPIQCAGAFFPDCDINGKLVQEWGVEAKTPDCLSIVSFAADGQSHICFVWLDDSDNSCSEYIAAVAAAPHERLPAMLGALLLQVSENCHFSPDWYEALPPEGKQWVVAQMQSGFPTSELLVPARVGGDPYFAGISVASATLISS